MLIISVVIISFCLINSVSNLDFQLNVWPIGISAMQIRFSPNIKKYMTIQFMGCCAGLVTTIKSNIYNCFNIITWGSIVWGKCHASVTS